MKTVVCVFSVVVGFSCLAQRTIGEPVLGSDILKGCEVSAFGAKLLDGATYVEDAYLKTSPKWVNQAVKIDGVVAKLPDGREVTLVWQTGKAEKPIEMGAPV